MTTEPVVFVVDDDATLRDSLCWLLQSMNLRAQAFASAADFLSAYEPTQPGCLLLDVRMPGMSGLQLQDIMDERGLQLPVIIVTGHGDVAVAVRAMKAGARDFVEKPFNDQALLDRVQEALEVDAAARRVAAERRAIAERVGTLTHREHQVLEAIVSGSANKQIAASLGISVKTVEIHRGRVMHKMRARSVAELTALCLRGSQ